jgi:hypothetical protein
MILAMSLRHLTPALTLATLLVAPAAPGAESLDIVLTCPACEAASAPVVAITWRSDAPGGAAALPTWAVKTRDWAAGSFELLRPDTEAATLPSEPVDDGWRLTLPTQGARPFRVVGRLEGYTAPRSAYWPERDQDRTVDFAFEPVPAVLEANPTWDPARTDECDVLVPKDLSGSVTFYLRNWPTAWLYPPSGAGASSPAQGPWAFQFVRPGGSLLDRIQVEVIPSDEGADWGFRVPLLAVTQATSAEGKPVRLRMGRAGRVDLADCPRSVEPTPGVGSD